jgi:hypothetical protein
VPSFQFLFMNKKRILVISGVSCFLLFSFFYFSPRGAERNTINKHVKHSQFDNFEMEGAYCLSKENNKVRFSLSVGKIIHRGRTSRFFKYMNLKELYMEDLAIDIYPFVEEKGAKKISIPVRDLGHTFTALGKPSEPPSEYLDEGAAPRREQGRPVKASESPGEHSRERSDLDMTVLTRLVITNLKIRTHLRGGKEFSIRAKSADINLLQEPVLVMENAILTASDGSEILSGMSVWTERFKGVLFPDGYMTSNSYHPGKSFFYFNRAGLLCKSDYVPEIHYEDIIGKEEQDLADRMTKNMSPEAKFFLGVGTMNKIRN